MKHVLYQSQMISQINYLVNTKYILNFYLNREYPHRAKEYMHLNIN